MNTARFQAALAAFDAANARDPTATSGRPFELVQAERLSAWVARLAPDASEALQLAARCQHLERWVIARSTYPEGREGYLAWRAELARHHARRAGEILESLGYPGDVSARVRSLNLKDKHDPDFQVLEDALCLVFLETQFAELAERTEHAAMVRILRKTWKKMSSRGRDAALALQLGEREAALIHEALHPERAQDS